MGAALGYGFALLVNQLGWAELSLSNFTLVGMSALMAGVLQAPLTAIFLIAELTGGYELMVPLMITSTIGFITVKYGTKHTVYTTQLATRGELITHHKDKAVLTLMNLKNEIETDFIRVDPYATLGELVQSVSKARRNLFPVVDTSGYLLGVVTLDDIREIMFDQELYNGKYVHELMSVAPDFIYTTDNMELVMKKFDKSGAWNLPVLEEEGLYIGFVSKSKLFTAYRKHLNNMYVPED
jgi:CIC family chloride channel protein